MGHLETWGAFMGYVMSYTFSLQLHWCILYLEGGGLERPCG